jgi:hypothetical protein
MAYIEPPKLRRVDDSVSIDVLKECEALQRKKSADYQAVNSSVRQIDYYPRGIDTILDIILAKYLRMRSIADKSRDSAISPNNESLEDSAMDMINYASFLVAYLRKQMPGQTNDRDAFNRSTLNSAILKKQDVDWRSEETCAQVY